MIKCTVIPDNQKHISNSSQVIEVALSLLKEAEIDTLPPILPGESKFLHAFPNGISIWLESSDKDVMFFVLKMPNYSGTSTLHYYSQRFVVS